MEIKDAQIRDLTRLKGVKRPSQRVNRFPAQCDQLQQFFSPGIGGGSPRGIAFFFARKVGDAESTAESVGTFFDRGSRSGRRGRLHFRSYL